MPWLLSAMVWLYLLPSMKSMTSEHTKMFFLNTNLETQSQEMTDRTLSTHKPKESILPLVISAAVVRAVNAVLSTATFHSIKR